MKNLFKYILSLVILFGVVPVNGQEAIVVKTAETCSTQEVKECCQIALSEDVKKQYRKVIFMERVPHGYQWYGFFYFSCY